jgi:tetratricopeptide (TPR) repeat protein
MGNWPSPQDYNEAIQTPGLAFDEPELKQGTPELTKLGLPRVMTGAFASVYRMHCGKKDWAVRCFLREVKDQQERYAVLSDYLLTDDLLYTVHFEYLPKGIKVQGSWFPILKMEWVEGDTIDHFIRKHRYVQEEMKKLLTQFERMLYDLREAGIAHGDLQHGNIVVNDEGLRLVDYDGMYVPGMKDWLSNELGHRNYQHPERTEKDFSPALDNYSARVIRTSLSCLIEDADLWSRTLAGEECLLFRQMDYQKPLSSHTFHLMERHQVEAVRTAAAQLRGSLTYEPLHVPFIDMLVPDPVDLPAFETMLAESQQAEQEASLVLSANQARQMMARQPSFQRSEKVAEPGTADGYCHQGNVKLTAGNYSQAMRYFQKAIHLNADCYPAFYGLGLANIARRDYAIAQSNFSAAIRMDSKNAEAYAGRGLALSGMGQHVRAMMDFNQALQINSRSARALTGRGLAQVALRQQAAAMLDVEQAIRTSPTAFTYCGHGQVLYATKAYREALESLDTAVRIDNHCADAYYWRAMTKFALDDAPGAIEDLEQCLVAAPEYFEALCAIGEIYNQSAKHEKAIEAFNRALELDDRQPERSWIGLGMANYELRNYRLAGGYFEKVFERNQTFPAEVNQFKVALARGFVLVQNGEIEKALQNFTTAARNDHSQMPEAHFGRGIAFYRLGMTEDALQAFDTAHKMKWTNPELLGWLSMTQFDAGDISGAEATCQSVPDNASQTSPPVLCARGYLRLRASDFERATSNFKQALKVDPGMIEADRGLQLTEGFKLLAKSNFRKSQFIFDELIKSKRNDALSFRGRALALMGSGKHREAEMDLREVEFLRPNALDNQILNIRLLALRKKYNEALDLLNPLIETHSEEPILYETRALIFEYTKDKRRALEDRKRAEILAGLKQEYPMVGTASESATQD